MPLKLVFFLVLFCFQLSIEPLSAQVYQQKQYTIEDGLASNETFSVVRGKHGYIWVATDKGISKYDGHTFKTFGVAEGLQSAVIYKLFASPLGGVIFRGADNKMGIIKNDSVNYLKIGGAVPIKEIYTIHRKGFVVCYENINTCETYSWKGEMLEKKQFPPDLLAKELDSSSVIGPGSLWNPSAFIRRQNGEKILLETFQHESIGPVSIFRKYPFTILRDQKALVVLGEDDEYFKIPLSSRPTFDGSIIDSKKRMWVGLYKKGVEIFSVTEKELLFKFLDGYSISSVYEDSEGIFWLTTLEGGLIRLKLGYYNPIVKGKVSMMSCFNGNIVAVINSTMLFFYDLKQKTHELLDVGKEIADLLPIEDSLFLSLHYWYEGRPAIKKKLRNKSIRVLKFSGGKLGNNKNGPLGLINGYFFKEGMKTQVEIEPGYTYFIQTHKDSIFAGTSRGLYYLYEDEGKHLSHKVLPIAVTCMKSYENQFILGTKGHGLLVSNRKFSIKQTFSTRNGLSGNFISAIERRGDTLICGTENGISMLTNVFDSGLSEIISSTRADGLWSGNTTSLILKDEELYVGTDQGIQKISISDFDKPRINPRPIIEFINNRQIFSDTTVAVEAGTKRIKFGLNTIFFHEDRSYIQEYRLLGRDSNWVSTASSSVEFLDLPPGEYEMQFRTKLWKNKHYTTAKLPFQVLPSFTQTFIFKLLIIVLSMLIFYALVRLRDNQQKKEAKMLISQEQLRYKTLTAQLNPHFMFNALGSIQNLIITQKNELAAEYLASFSGLLNKTLQNTNHFFIPLVDEIAFIDEYILVEKSRFEKPFEFNWHLSNEIDKHKVLVPTMFLQPYIENSILHGINPLKASGKIEVVIKKLKENVLEIRVVDNGIGMVASKKVQGRRIRKSLAMNNIQARIQAMEKLYKNIFRQETRELLNTDGSVAGTEVLLDIPYQLKSE